MPPPPPVSYGTVSAREPTSSAPWREAKSRRSDALFSLCGARSRMKSVALMRESIAQPTHEIAALRAMKPSR